MDLTPAQEALLGYMEGQSEARWSAGWLSHLDEALQGDAAYDWLVQQAGGTWRHSDKPLPEDECIGGRDLVWAPLPRPRIGKDAFAEAARNNDAVSEEIGLAAWCAAHNIVQEDFAYVAEQRGLRGVLLHSGRSQPSPSHMSVYRLSSAERRLQAAFAAMWMDGVGTGLTVRRDGS